MNQLPPDIKFFRVQQYCSFVDPESGKTLHAMPPDYVCAPKNPVPDAMVEVDREEWDWAVEEARVFWGLFK